MLNASPLFSAGALLATRERTNADRMPDKFFSAAASMAARQLKYPVASQLILSEGTGPQAVVRLFRTSASKRWREDVGRIIIAGSLAQRRGEPHSWTEEPAAGIVRDLLGNDLQRISAQAEKFVANFWPHIEALAHGAAAVA